MKIVNLNLLLSFIRPDIFPLVDIVKHKNLHDAVLFHCCNENLAISDQKIFLQNEIRISSVKLVDDGSNNILHSYGRIGVVVNASCPDWEGSLNKIDSKVTFQNPFVWVFITDNLTATVNTLSHYAIEVDADVTIVHKAETSYHIYDVYNTGFRRNGVFIVKNIGYWNSRLIVTAKDKRNDLSGVVIKCTVVILHKVVNETFEEYLRQARRVGFDSIHKLKYFVLLKYLRDMYNMTYDLQRTNTWGYLRNGTFDGMVGALQRHESEIGGSPLFFRADRNEIIDYTAEVWHSRHSFIFRNPKHSKGYYTIYTRPLNASVWYCIIALLALSGAVLYLIFKWNMLMNTDEDDDSPSLAWLFMWSALCQQGMILTQKSASVKFMVFMTFFYAVVLYQYYNAVVVSMLLMEPPKNIKTLNDLLQSNLKAGAEEALYDRDFFKRTTDPIALEIYKKKIKIGNKENFYAPEKGMALVQRGGFAFHVDTVTSFGIISKTFSEKEICEISDVTMYTPHRLGVIMRKGSPYRDYLAYGIRKMMESGLMQRVQSAWDEPKPRCVKTPDSSIFSVSIREVTAPLIVLSVGMMTSLMVLFFEMLTHKLSRMNGTLLNLDFRY